MIKAYAGIGSRETPHHVQQWMTAVAGVLDQHGWCLRSGGADGADTAFEAGHTQHKEIFLPWDGFNGRSYPVIPLRRSAYLVAEHFHPNWARLSPAARLLMARNTYQVLGQESRDPSKFILCWTPKGSGSGGTGQALRIAKAHSIPALDLGLDQDIVAATTKFLTVHAPETVADLATAAAKYRRLHPLPAAQADLDL